MYKMRTHPYDIVIQNGRLLDPSCGLDIETDLGITGRKIQKIGKIDNREGKTVVDASGCYVTPGLIDYHAHLDYGSDWASVPAELYGFPSGITTAVDGGSAGCGGYDSFYRNVVCRSMATIKGFLFIGTSGQVGLGCVEDQDPSHINEELIMEICDKYRDSIVGIKVKTSKEHVGGMGLEPLKAAVAMGEKTGLRVSAHITNPAGKVDDILEILRPGDIYCHVYHGMGEGILTEEGGLRESAVRARERGILFDAAHGKTINFSLRVAEEAIGKGFLPDIISSDFTKISLTARYPFSYMLSEYLNMGMSFAEILTRCSTEPARLLYGCADGFLQEGKIADLAIFRISERNCRFTDYFNDTLTGNKVIETQMTIKEGLMVYDQMKSF